jgi:hypothetical protein
LVSSGSGAKRFSIDRVTRVAAAPLFSSFLRTLPMLTPARRTSACSDRVAASRKSTFSSYLRASIGVDPPNEIHRNRKTAKQPNVNAIIVGRRNA